MVTTWNSRGHQPSNKQLITILSRLFLYGDSHLYNNNNTQLSTRPHTKEQSLHTSLLYTLRMTISPYYPQKQKTPVQRNSTLYKACTLALPTQLHSPKQVRVYLSDLLIQIILSWAFSCHLYNPHLPFNQQQNTIIHFLIKTSLPRPLLSTTLCHVKEHLLILASMKQLNRAQVNSRCKSKYHSNLFICWLVDPTDNSSLDSFPADPDDPPDLPDPPDHVDRPYVTKQQEQQQEKPYATKQQEQQQEKTSRHSKQQEQGFHPNPLSTDPDHICPNNCYPPCNKQCLVCRFFWFHHPSLHCQWTNTRITRSCTPRTFLHSPIQFDFCQDDLEKMKLETTQDDSSSSSSSSSYSQSTTSSLSSTSSQTKKIYPRNRHTIAISAQKD